MNNRGDGFRKGVFSNPLLDLHFKLSLANWKQVANLLMFHEFLPVVSGASFASIFLFTKGCSCKVKISN